ncbi:MAG: LuxR C-terminal-related transcriptional regulator [Pseudomonadota bacterium]
MQRHFDILETITDIADVLRYVRKLSLEAGATRMSYHVVPQFSSQTSRSTAIISHGFSDEWLALYEQQEFRQADPIPGRVMDFGSMMPWQDAMMWKPNTPEQEAYFEKMREFDLIYGFGVPLYGGGGRDAYASFDFLRHVDEVDPKDIGLVRALSQAGHQRISILEQWQGERPNLSEREVEVLTWVAQGKSLNTIATILELSPETVKTYSKRIYAKLDVADRVGAVITALRQGIIKV